MNSRNPLQDFLLCYQDIVWLAWTSNVSVSCRQEIPSHGVEVQSSIATSRQIFTFPNIDKVFSRVRNS